MSGAPGPDRPTATRPRGLRSLVHADVLHPEMRGEGAGSASGFPPWQSTTTHVWLAMEDDLSRLKKILVG